MLYIHGMTQKPSYQNLILKKLPKTFPTDQAKIKWELIKNEIESVSKTDSSFSSFLNHYWISSYQKLKDDDEIYYDFKANPNLSADLFDPSHFTTTRWK